MPVHKLRFFVIPADPSYVRQYSRRMTEGIQNLLKTLDSGLRTAGMTVSTR